MSDIPTLEDLVHAICEGTPIDWDALEQVGSETFRSQIAALRIVAGIAEVHRPQAAATRPPPDAPQRWGHLDVLEYITSGAFGDVYRAWDPQLDREVALKLLRRAPDAEAHADEVVDEGRLLARLRHPHIVSVYGAARIDGQVGLWMEYLRGRTLAQAVSADGALPIRKVAEIGAALCDALGAVHKAGLVHRDVKAQNVMLADDGRVVLMDFGAGRDVRHVGLDMAGTPLYLAPEVARGAPASPQSDLYSLGVLLRFAATGAYSHDVGAVPNDKTFKRLLAVITVASARNPADRYASAEACGRALRDLLVPSRVSPTLVVAGASVVVVLGALLVALMRAGSAQDNDDRAFEFSWRTASPRQAPLSAQQSQSLDMVHEVNESGALPATIWRPDGQASLITVTPGSDELRTFISHSSKTGHAESLVPSLDGLQLAYVWIDTTCRCATIRVANRQGTERTLFARPGLRGAWLGEWRNGVLPALLAPELGPHELALVDVAAGAVRVLRQVDRDPQGFSLSPDRRFLAFDAPQQRGPGALREIVVVDVHTGRHQKVASPGRNWAVPRWSPDGSRLFFLDREPHNTVLLAVRMEEGRAVRPPVRLRDNLGASSFGFVSATTLGYWSSPQSNLFTVRARSDGTFSASEAVRAAGSLGNMPAWSRDGRRLAWTDFGEPTATIRVQGADGRPQVRVSGLLDAAIFPVWSPDGRRLAFWTSDQLTHSVQVVDLTSGKMTEHFRRGYSYIGGEYALAWTGDGKHLLVTTSPDQIMSIDPDSGTLGTFYKADRASIEGYLYLSPDGHSLALFEARNERSQMRVIPLDSLGIAVVLDVSQYLVVGWHPDGRSVLAVRTILSPESNLLGDSELCRVPIDGTPAQSLGLQTPGMVYAAMSPDTSRVAYASGGGGGDLWFLGPASSR